MFFSTFCILQTPQNIANTLKGVDKAFLQSTKGTQVPPKSQRIIDGSNELIADSFTDGPIFGFLTTSRGPLEIQNKINFYFGLNKHTVSTYCFSSSIIG